MFDIVKNIQQYRDVAKYIQYMILDNPTICPMAEKKTLLMCLIMRILLVLIFQFINRQNNQLHKKYREQPITSTLYFTDWMRFLIRGSFNKVKMSKI